MAAAAKTGIKDTRKRIKHPAASRYACLLYNECEEQDFMPNITHGSGIIAVLPTHAHQIARNRVMPHFLLPRQVPVPHGKYLTSLRL